ncbi:glycosyltransferase family 39 protein [Thermodesulfobacteriota bacterium]
MMNRRIRERVDDFLSGLGSPPPRYPVEAGDARAHHPWLVASLALVLFGTAFRLFTYFSVQPLNYDEIRLLLNVVDRSYRGLLEPLSHEQGAPLGFLFATKLFTNAAGEGELAARLFPLLCGIGSLCIFWVIAHRHLRGIGALVALTLISLSPTLIHRSAEFKQYSTDIFMMSAMLLALLEWLGEPRTTGRWILMTCIGAFCLGFSHPSVLYLGPVSLLLFCDSVVEKDWKQLRRVGGVLTIWVCVLSLAFWFNMRHIMGRDHFMVYWQPDFMPTDSLGAALYWLAKSPLKIAKMLGCHRILSIVLVLPAAAGLLSFLSRKRLAGLAMVLMFIAPLVAAMMRIYPFGDRLIVFMIPLLLVCLAEGLNRLTSIWRPLPLLVWCLCIVVFGGASVRAYVYNNHPYQYPDIKSTLEYLDAHASDDEPILVSVSLNYPYSYYSRFRAWGGQSFFLSPQRGVDLSGDEVTSLMREAIDTLGSLRSLWVLVGSSRHIRRGVYEDPRPAYLAAMNSIGQIRDIIEYQGITLYHVSASGHGGAI